MKIVILALAALLVQQTLAWDMKGWGDWWWEQDTIAPAKIKHHHKHHKHYRHHHHRPQTCLPAAPRTETTTGPIGVPSPSPNENTDPFFPYNIGGKLTNAGVNCSNTITSKAYARFNAIFFGNFITSEAQDILGPLAVAGDFSAHAYTVNAQHGANCTDVSNSFDGYGLIVGTEDASVKYSDVHVHGAVFLPDGSVRQNIQELDQACSVYNDRGTGLMNFTQVQLNAIEASRQFSTLPPTLQLDSNGNLKRIKENTYGYDVLTFGSCSTCDYDSTTFSSPDAIYYGKGNWNGPIGMSWPTHLIINIAVLTDSTITIQGNQPSLGMQVCNTVLNFYPSNSVGSYQTGSFQVDRSTGGQLGGFMLLPEGDIADENHGAFAGQIVANNYRWSSNGIEIHDYQAIGGSCLTTDVCIPIFVNGTIDRRPNPEDPPPPDIHSETHSSDESSSDESSSDESSSDESSSDESSSDESSSDESISEDSSSSSSSNSSEDINSSINSSSSSSSSSSSETEDVISSSDSSGSSESSDSSIESSDSSSESSDSSNQNSSDDNSSSSESSNSNDNSNSISDNSSSSSNIESSLTISESSSNAGLNSHSTASRDLSISSSSRETEFVTPSTPTYCPTETSTVQCHTHQHQVARTQYLCEQGFVHDEQVLVCQHDSHHHHRKDYYAGHDDDNFENDPEFGLYDFEEFDEECDIDHGVTNDHDDEYRYYKYKGKKHHGEGFEDEDDLDYDEDEEKDEQDEDQDEDENEDEDEDEDQDQDEDDDEDEDEDEGEGKDKYY